MKKSAEERNAENVQRQNKKNAASRDLVIPDCKDPDRRALCEMDIFDWLKTYFPKAFYRPFTDQQKEIVRVILSCATDRTTQAIAAPRGSGKSVIARRVILFMILTGQLRFAVIVAATGRDAKNMLKAIKSDLHTNRALLDDYPDACYPIREVARSPRKCALQTVKGEFTDINWQPEQIKLPTVEGSRSSGAKIYARSLDGSIRGLNEDDERPDFVLIDDPETQESAKSIVQIESREHTINQDLSGLAVQGDPLGMLMLSTAQTQICLTLKYTDPKQYPAWDGKRWKSLESWPTNKALWDEYILIREQNQQDGDKWGAGATEYYREHQAEMDAGAIVANPYAVPKGCISALQGLYNFIADKKLNAFLTEYQNDPPQDEGIETSGLTDLRIINKQWTGEQFVVPKETQIITAQIDMGKYACHWEVNAWLANDAGFTVDYGVVEVVGTEVNGAKEQTDTAIERALSEFRDLMMSERYFDEQGEHRQVNLVMADSGDFTDAVYRFVATTGGFFVASKGYGDTYSSKPGPDKILGNHYYTSSTIYDRTKRINLVHLDSNHWKQKAVDGWQTPTLNEDKSYRAGSMSIYHTKEKSRHHSIAKHKTAEEFREAFIPGNKGMKRYWHKLRANNHWGDTGYMGYAAREIVKAKLNAARRRAATPPIPQGESMFPSLQGVSFNPAGY
jgi:hypothetical protein